MAQWTDLIAAIQPQDGRPLGKLQWISRCCQEAGVLPNPGRAGAAIDLSPRDAVALLLASAGPDVGRDAPMQGERFASMEPAEYNYFADPDFKAGEFTQPIHDALAEAATFGKAIEALFAVSGELVMWLSSFAPAGYKSGPRWRYGLDHKFCGIDFDTYRHHSWATAAKIKIWHADMERLERGEITDFQQRYDPMHVPLPPGYPKPDRRIDRETRCRFGATLLVTAIMTIHQADATAPARKDAAPPPRLTVADTARAKAKRPTTKGARP